MRGDLGDRRRLGRRAATEIRPSSISRSSAAASSRWAAIVEDLGRAPRGGRVGAAPPRITALRLPPVPGPNGADAVSPWMTRDVVDVDAEVVGDHLGHRRLEALAVAAAAHQGLHLAVGADADDRAARWSCCPNASARRLDVAGPMPMPTSRPSARAAACSARSAS